MTEVTQFQATPEKQQLCCAGYFIFN